MSELLGRPYYIARSLGPIQRRRKPRAASHCSPAGAVLVAWLTVTAIGAVLWFLNPNAQFIFFGGLVSSIVTLPALSKRFSIASPWSLLAAAVYSGSGLRGIFIGLGIEGDVGSLDRLFLLGQPPDYFLWPSLVYVAGLAIVTFVYGFRPSVVESTSRSVFTFNRTALVVATIFALIGLLAFLLFAQQTGGLSFSDLSRKRTTISGLDLADDYTSYGELRFLASFSGAAFWVVVAYIAKNVSDRKTGIGYWLLMLGFGINAISLPIYASSRTTAALTLLVAWVIYGTINRRSRIAGRSATLMLITVLILLSTMTFLRAGAQGNGDTVVTAEAGLDAALNTVVYNRNFGDMQTTSHVINNVPETIPFQNGATIAGWAVAPVPRSIWPEKPIVNVGPMIGVQIYGTARSGVPPGLVGDLYMNFALPGVLLGAVAMGFLLRTLERWRVRRVGNNVGLIVLYMAVGLQFGMVAISKGIGATIFQSVYLSIPVLITLLGTGVFRRNSGGPVRR